MRYIGGGRKGVSRVDGISRLCDVYTAGLVCVITKQGRAASAEGVGSVCGFVIPLYVIALYLRLKSINSNGQLSTRHRGNERVDTL